MTSNTLLSIVLPGNENLNRMEICTMTKRYQGMFSCARSLLTVSILLAGTMFLCAATVSSARSQESRVSVSNMTSRFRVVSTSRSQDRIHLSLRNDYDKAITAYVISVGKFTFKEEFVFSENDSVISPGSTYALDLPLSSSLQGNPSLQLTVLAVLFLDKTNDGNQKVVNSIAEERLGAKIQILRVVPLLERLLEVPGNRATSTFVTQIKPEIESLLSAPEADTIERLRSLNPATLRATDTKVSEGVKSGMKTARESILNKLELLDRRRKFESGESLQKESAKLKEHYAKVLARL